MANDQAMDIAALIERLGRLFARDAHAEGLLPVHWEALRYLNQANQFSRNHSALTAYLGLTKGTVSQTLKALEGKGLIRKEADKHDRRSKHLGLTVRGKKMLERDPIGDWIGELSALPQADQQGLAHGLSTLINNRLANQGRAPFGQCQTCLYFVAEHKDGKPHYCDLLKTDLSPQAADLICAEHASA